MFLIRFCFSFFLSFLFWNSIALAAQATEGISFYHKDWEITCDNTRTCRAAGYSIEDSSLVSVLLSREAGANRAIMAQVRFESETEMEPYLQLEINGKSLGNIILQNGLGQLSLTQVTALIAAVVKTGTVEFVIASQRHILSGEGATAVLLKMDEFQGRLQTTGALVRKGSKSEANILPALPIPQINVPALTSQRSNLTLNAETEAQLQADFQKECENKTWDITQVDILQLNNRYLLASSACWLAAYNSGSIVWLVKNDPPYQVSQITTNASDVDSATGQVTMTMKGRGVGDCWSQERWDWTGKNYVTSYQSSTGMCRGFTGGAWELPEIITKVTYAH